MISTTNITLHTKKIKAAAAKNIVTLFGSGMGTTERCGRDDNANLLNTPIR
jgi:hypothetical protein